MTSECLRSPRVLGASAGLGQGRGAGWRWCGCWPCSSSRFCMKGEVSRGVPGARERPVCGSTLRTVGLGRGSPAAPGGVSGRTLFANSLILRPWQGGLSSASYPEGVRFLLPELGVSRRIALSGRKWQTGRWCRPKPRPLGTSRVLSRNRQHAGRPAGARGAGQWHSPHRRQTCEAAQPRGDKPRRARLVSQREGCGFGGFITQP